MKNYFWACGVAAGVLVLLAGCRSASAPASVATPWSPPRAAQATEKTWQEIRARQPDFPKPQSLAELADLALQNNPATRKAWNDARVAAAQVAQARGYFLPTLTAAGNVSRARTDANPDTLSSDYLQYGPALQLNYLIINFGGGRSAAVEQALQTVYAANFTFNRTLQAVLLAVQNAYFGVVSAQAGLEAAQAQVQDAQTALEAAKLRQANGVGNELEVLQAQALADQALLGQASAEGALKTAQSALTQALGIPADAPVKVIAPTNDLPVAPDTQHLSQLIDEALQRRPDIAALRARLAASEAAITVAGAQQWPNLYATGRASRDYNERWSGQFQPDNDWSYAGGLSLQWTFFDGLQTINAKRAAQAQAESVRSQLQQAELAASAEVWNGHQTYATALKKFQFSGAALRSSQAAYDLALDSYKAGLKSILDLLGAESQLAQARSQHIAARQEAFTALANLAFVSGSLEKDNLDRPTGATPMEKGKL
ncbi:MAG: TolC family protein [Verrucomicrobia bacterium]|nr:MAG: TolC family protein [Verrucomicrobiota bacterium]